MNLANIPADVIGRGLLVSAYMHRALKIPRVEAAALALRQHVAAEFDKLMPDRKWALGSPEQLLAGEAHFKYTRVAVEAAYREARDRDIEPETGFPAEWQFSADYGEYLVVA